MTDCALWPTFYFWVVEGWKQHLIKDKVKLDQHQGGGFLDHITGAGWTEGLFMSSSVLLVVQHNITLVKILRYFSNNR